MFKVFFVLDRVLMMYLLPTFYIFSKSLGIYEMHVKVMLFSFALSCWMLLLIVVLFLNKYFLSIFSIFFPMKCIGSIDFFLLFPDLILPRLKSCFLHNGTESLWLFLIEWLEWSLVSTGSSMFLIVILIEANSSLRFQV